MASKRHYVIEYLGNPDHSIIETTGDISESYLYKYADKMMDWLLKDHNHAVKLSTHETWPWDEESEKVLTPEPEPVKLDDSRFQSLRGDGKIYETNVGYGASD